MCVNMHLCVYACASVCTYAQTCSLTPVYIATFPAEVMYGAVLLFNFSLFLEQVHDTFV